MATVRDQLATALKPLLPKAWRIIPYTTNLDTVDGVTLMMRQTRIEKAPNSQGNHQVTLVLTVIDPHTDPQRAEDALDEEVGQLLYAFLPIEWLNWTVAERVVFGELNHAYDITLTLYTKAKEV